MQKKLSVSRYRSLTRRLPGTIALALFLTLLLGSFLLTLSMARQSKQGQASTPGQTTLAHAGSTTASSPGVYIGTGDGALDKLDGATGSLRWRYKTLGMSIPAAATVLAGKVYLGSQEGTVYALNASDGTLLWQFHTNLAVVASPTAVNGIVYIGSSDGNLYALNASTGKPLWHYRVGPANVALVANTVIVSNGVVYGSSSDEVSQSYLFAVDATSGAQRWRIRIQNQRFTAPQAANGVLYLASWALKQEGGPDITDSYVYAFSAKDGSLLWRSNKIGDFILSTPTIVNGVVYSGSRDSYLYAFKADTGKLLWHTNVSGEIYSSPQVDNGIVYAGVLQPGRPTAPGSTSDTTPPRGIIVAMNASTGALLWQSVVANYQGTPLTVFRAVLYLGTADGSVYALSASNGATIWHYRGTTAVILPSDNAPITVAP